MATITIPDVPEDVLEAARRSAAAAGRSIEEDMRERLKQAYAREVVEEILARASGRWVPDSAPITPEVVEGWINAGRA